MLIILSVGVGLFCGIWVLAIYRGMMTQRVHTVINYETGSIQIHHPQFKKDYEARYTIDHQPQWFKLIKDINGLVAFGQRTLTLGMLATTTGSAGVQVNGVIDSIETKVSGLNKKIIEGDGFKGERSHQIIIGKKLAEKMKLKIGNKLVLTFTDTGSNLVSAAFRVAAIYQSDNSPLDERNVYINQSELNSLLGIGNSIHEIIIILKNDEHSEFIKEQLQKQLPSYQVESWRDLSPETELMVNTVDVYSYIIITIIMIALTFGIINTMLMAVLERTKEIGMMLALGLDQLKMFFLIGMETIFLTLVGTPIGFTAAYLSVIYYEKQGMDWSGMGKEMMSSFGFSTTIFPLFPTNQVLMVILIVIFASLISCIFPALKALQLKPVEALRK